MKVCVIGSGYVGLVAAACFADTGNDVISADIDANKIAGLKENILPIYEPGLKEIVVRNQGAGRLHFTTDVADGIQKCDIIFIAVGTPPDEDGSADLKRDAVAGTIGDNLNGYKVVVNKSTVPVGTGDIVAEIIAGRSDGEFTVVSNPEFLKEGAAVRDFLKPDRIIIGTEDEQAREMMSALYAPYQRTSNRIQFMDVRSAEMTKYAANAMLATRITRTRSRGSATRSARTWPRCAEGSVRTLASATSSSSRASASVARASRKTRARGDGGAARPGDGHPQGRVPRERTPEDAPR